MKRITKIAIIIALLSTLLLICGCGGVSKEDLTDAIKAKDISTITDLINQVKDQDDKDEIYAAAADEFKKLCKSTDWDDYVFMDKIIKKTKDKKLKKQLKKVIRENGDNKVIAFIKGKWVRRDYTDMDGMIINVKWNDKDGAGIVTSTKNARNNKYTFARGDIKWKDIKVISSNEFVYKDLFKSTDYSDYLDSYATINYDCNQIKVKVTNAGSKDYNIGNKQVWVRESAIDKKKENLKKKDFINKTFSVKKLSDLEDHFYYFYELDYVADKKLRKTLEKENDITTRYIRGVKGGESREEVIKAFGPGHIIYQNYKKDPIYKLYDYMLESNNDPKTRNLLKGLHSSMAKSNYSVLYYNKEKGPYIKMYFDKKNKLIGALAAKDYSLWIKASKLL